MNLPPFSSLGKTKSSAFQHFSLRFFLHGSVSLVSEIFCAQPTTWGAVPVMDFFGWSSKGWYLCRHLSGHPSHRNCQFAGCHGHPENGLMTIYQYYWVNYHISPTWILRPFGDDFPQSNHDFQGSGEQGSVVIVYPEIHNNQLFTSYLQLFPIIYQLFAAICNKLWPWHPGIMAHGTPCTNVGVPNGMYHSTQSTQSTHNSNCTP